MGSPRGSKCVDCHAGQYSSGSAAIACTHCSFGHAIAKLGRQECTPCLPGAYQDSTGQQACKRCALGMFSKAPGAAECANCPAGYTSPESTDPAEACELCPAGSVQPSPGQSQCEVCGVIDGAGTFGSTDRLRCLECLPGTAGSGSGMFQQCDACEGDTYSSIIGGTACNMCPPNSRIQFDRASCECNPGSTCTAWH